MSSRREFLTAAAGTAALHGAEKRPNILFLLPDQHRAQATGCYGDEQAQTPHIDRLASEGLVMDRTFANTPVCCPARSILLTGQYCHRNGMVANDLRLREDSTSMARTLRDAGYRTGFVGKWHLDGGPRLPGYVPPGARRQGYDFWVANECSHNHFRNTVFRDSPDPIVLDKFETDAYADFALEFLNASKREDRPFYLTVQWGPPHDPYKAPPEYASRFDAAKLKMRPNWQVKAGAPGPQEIAHYYGMVTAIDDAVGRILKRVDELGMRDNTIVFYASDHGDMLGSQGEGLKRKPWEESIRVPGVLRWPGHIPQGRRSEQFFTHVDFAPTLLGLAGVAVPKAMQGANLAPSILQGKPGPDSAFFQIFGPFHGDGTNGAWRGVRTEQYMYARYADRPWVLYDLKKDPFQLKNLANEDSAGAIRQMMEARLTSWMASTGDSWSNNWTHPVEDNGRLYKNRTFYSVGEYLSWAKLNPQLDR